MITDSDAVVLLRCPGTGGDCRDDAQDATHVLILFPTYSSGASVRQLGIVHIRTLEAVLATATIRSASVPALHAGGGKTHPVHGAVAFDLSVLEAQDAANGGDAATATASVLQAVLAELRTVTLCLVGRTLRRLGGPVEWLQCTTAPAAATSVASLDASSSADLSPSLYRPVPSTRMRLERQAAAGGASFSHMLMCGQAELSRIRREEGNAGDDDDDDATEVSLLWDVMRCRMGEATGGAAGGRSHAQGDGDELVVVLSRAQRAATHDSVPHLLVGRSPGSFSRGGQQDSLQRIELHRSGSNRTSSSSSSSDAAGQGINPAVMTLSFMDGGKRVKGTANSNSWCAQAAQGTSGSKTTEEGRCESSLYLAYRRSLTEALWEDRPPSELLSADAAGVAELLSPLPPETHDNTCRPGLPPTNIIFVVGAGISVAAGIPDYRTPGTGLYHTLEKYGLPTPESVFTLAYLRSNPAVFYDVERNLPDMSCIAPTTAHQLMKAVSDSGRLRRVYTQNVDGLEFSAGVPPARIVAAHGHSRSAHCIDCHAEMPIAQFKDIVFTQRAIPYCETCGGIVKPDFVLYGESLPDRFFQLADEDMDQCDCLIVMGTSLIVQPFCNLVTLVPRSCPRIVINREKVGENLGLRFNDAGDAASTRDVFLGGDLQQHCATLMKLF